MQPDPSDPLEHTQHARKSTGPTAARAALCLVLAETLAGGWDTPGRIVVASMILWGALALAFDLLARVARRPGLGVGLLLATAMGLEGLSTASKELSGAAAGGAALLTVALAAAALVALLRVAPTWRHAVAPAALPAVAWLAATLELGPWARVLAVAAPLAFLAVARAATGRLGLVNAWPAVVLLVAFLPGRAHRRAPPPPSAAVAEGPSVVLVVVDTLRADAVPPDGAIATLGAEGATFTQCVSAAPWTLPSMSSLLTGRYPAEHGAVEAATPLGPEATTLAEVLHASGWATAAFTGGAFVGQAHGLDQGFEVFDAGSERRFPRFERYTPLVWRIAKNRYLPLRRLVRFVDEAAGFRGVTRAASEWLGTEGRRPVFLLLHTYQAHDYYLYDPDVDDAVLATLEVPARFARRLSVHPGELATATPDELAYFEALYRARIAAVDATLGDFARRAREVLGEDTVIVVTSDHGEGFDAMHGRVHHGGRLHDDLLRVPLAILAPGAVPSGARVDAPVRTVDVPATVLDLAGVALPEGLAGESLLPALRGERPFPGTAFAEEHAHGLDLLAARRADWKLIRTPDGTEVYHLADDPGERGGSGSEAPPELAAELARFRELHPPPERRTAELDPATLEELRALGYVD